MPGRDNLPLRVCNFAEYGITIGVSEPAVTELQRDEPELARHHCKQKTTLPSDGRQ
jgi:hypothetical protein